MGYKYNPISGEFDYFETGGATYVWSSGLTDTSNTITNDVLTGKSGGQTWIGGTAAGDILTIKGTSGNGTTSVAAIQLNVGNNGATSGINVFNDGRITIGGTGIGADSRKLRIIDTATIELGKLVGTSDLAAIYMNNTPASTNYCIGANNIGTITLLNGSSSVYFRIANNDIAQLDLNGLSLQSGKTLSLGNTATTGLVPGALAATTNASVVLKDFAGNSYRIPCII